MQRRYSKTFVEKMKKGLLGEREKLQEELAAINEELHVSETEQSGENDYEDEMADKGTTTFIRERDDSLAWNIKDLLYQVDNALARIEDGTYGQCAECPEGIPKERLEALPWASTCLTCRQKEGK